MFSFAVSLLSARDYSEAKMLEKLTKRFPNAPFEEKQEIITALKNQNFLNDEHLAQNWVQHWKEEGKMSKMMMQQKLFQKKIDKEIIEKILHDEKISNEKAIFYVAKHKWQSIKNTNLTVEKKKEKLFRFLLGKGFLFDEINTVWKEIQETQEMQEIHEPPSFY